VGELRKGTSIEIGLAPEKGQGGRLRGDSLREKNRKKKEQTR